MPFQPGQSGNPAGRPPGARNKVNRTMEPVFQANGEAIIERLVEHAKAANPVALRLCVDRLVPLGKHRQVGFQLPPMEKSDDVRAAIATIHAGIADGDISSGEAADLLRVADISARMLREAEAAPSGGLARELARHQRALAEVAAMLGCSPETLLGPADEDEGVAAAEEAPPIVNNNAEIMTDAATEAAQTDIAPSDAAPAAQADAEVQASAARESDPSIVNNNAETMAPADPPSSALPDLVGSNENTPDAGEDPALTPLRATSG